ncbi:alpha/beta hydrolase [Rhodococcus daqingensis]|uniref:Alpha/beta hydrolase n=1 Tax=Rhodococcus daqingensis TaxID=2479363 RepID=A0ABW2S5N6_9NOCA
MSAATGRGLVPRRLMRAIVRLTVRPLLTPTVPVRRQRRLLDAIGGVARLPRGTRVSTVELGGRPAERIEPPGADPTRAVLYLHGGGFTVGSRTTHRALAAHLAAAAGSPVYVLDYRLAPEHPFPAALDDATAAHDDLLRDGLDPGRVAMAGDSAGGGLAVAAAVRLRENGTPLPGALALISPWADLTLTTVRDDPRDPMLRRAWLRSCAARYSGAADPGAPELSPLFADLAGLPPMLVHAGEDEILRVDAQRLCARARAADVPVTERTLPGLWHVAHLHAGLVAESTAAARELGAFLLGSIGDADGAGQAGARTA